MKGVLWVLATLVAVGCGLSMLYLVGTAVEVRAVHQLWFVVPASVPAATQGLSVGALAAVGAALCHHLLLLLLAQC